MKYAYVISGVVQGILELPSVDSIHEDSRYLYVPCGEEVQPGWTCQGGVFAFSSIPLGETARTVLEKLEALDGALPRHMEDAMDMLQAKGLVPFSEWPDIMLARKAAKDGLRLKLKELL